MKRSIPKRAMISYTLLKVCLKSLWSIQY